MRGSSVFLFALLLTACTAAPGLPAATATPKLISRQQAIETTLKFFSMSEPEVSPPLASLTNIRAEQMLLGQAVYKMTGSADIPNGYLPGAPVWYVTLDGLWKDEGAAPGITPVAAYYHHAVQIIDAVTGDEVEGGWRP